MNDYGCKHFATYIICGVSEPAYSEKQLSELEEKDRKQIEIDEKTKSGYDYTQVMRRLETEIRKERVEIAGLKKAGASKDAINKHQDRILAFQKKHKQIADALGEKVDYERMAVHTPKTFDVKTKGVDKSTDGGIIEVKNDSSRRMSNGGRKTVYHTLTKREIAFLKADIKEIKADESVFSFNVGGETYYDDKYDIIFVCGNVLPDLKSKHPRDVMSARAVLAHEYYGHRKFKGTKAKPNSWNDEFRASYRAAKDTPNLSIEDRRYLVLDAIERAKESGVTIKYNNYMRKMIYG